MKVKKATGPDGISSRLLKSCADQLCRIVEYIFNMSLKLGKVPLLWKTSCVVPVPKTPHPQLQTSWEQFGPNMGHRILVMSNLTSVHLCSSERLEIGRSRMPNGSMEKMLYLKGGETKRFTQMQTHRRQDRAEQKARFNFYQS